MKEAECRNVERNYRVAASKQAELQLIAAPAPPPPPHVLLLRSQTERERIIGMQRGGI